MLPRDRFTYEAQHVAEEGLLKSQIKFGIFPWQWEPGNPLLIGLYLQVDCLADVIWQTPPRLIVQRDVDCTIGLPGHDCSNSQLFLELY